MSQQKVLRKILGKVFITKKFTQCKTSHILKLDAFEIPDKIRILEDFIQNMNCFSWINLVPVLVHLKYLYYDSPYSFPASCTASVKFYPSKLKSLFNTILIMFFIDFPIFSYPIRPLTTTSIGYTKIYPKQSNSNVLSSYIYVIISYGGNTLPMKKLSL